MAQDGSDILYLDNKDLSKDYINRYIHIDFYKNSFGTSGFSLKKMDSIPEEVLNRLRKADTVYLDFIKNQRFVEIRKDDGYNNWFSQQYLESVEINEDQKLRIQKMKLLNFSTDSIQVKAFGHYFKNNEEANS